MRVEKEGAQGSAPHNHLSASSQPHGHQQTRPAVSWSCPTARALIRTGSRLIRAPRTRGKGHEETRLACVPGESLR